MSDERKLEAAIRASIERIPVPGRPLRTRSQRNGPRLFASVAVLAVLAVLAVSLPVMSLLDERRIEHPAAVGTATSTATRNVSSSETCPAADRGRQLGTRDLDGNGVLDCLFSVEMNDGTYVFAQMNRTEIIALGRRTTMRLAPPTVDFYTVRDQALPVVVIQSAVGANANAVLVTRWSRTGFDELLDTSGQRISVEAASTGWPRVTVTGSAVSPEIFEWDGVRYRKS